MNGRLLRFCVIALVISTLVFCVDYPAYCKENNKPERIALVLGGGGARGAAHVGVLKVLERNGLKPDIIVGNSMGAIIGGMYCAGVPLEEIEVLIRKGEVKEAFKPMPVVFQFFKKLAQKLKFWNRPKFPGLYSGKSLEKFVNDHIPKDKKKIESLSPRFAATAVDLIDGNAYRIEKGDLARAVRASSSFPPLLKPVKIKDHVFTDGGVRSNVPTYAAIGMTADYVIAVNVDEQVNKIKEEDITSYTKLLNRLSSIIIYLRDKELLKKADLIIKPDVSGISVLSVNKRDYVKAVEAGEKAAEKKLSELSKVLKRRNKVAKKY